MSTTPPPVEDPVTPPASAATALAPIPETPELQEIRGIAQHFIKSGFFTDARELSKAITKIMVGKSLGLDPFASMANIYMVNGKLQLGAHVVGRLIKASGKYRYTIEETTNDVCTIILWEKVDTGPSSWEWHQHKPFTRRRDEYKHLHGNVNWKNHGRDMLFARTITSMGRMLCPEVMGGSVYAPDELPGTEDNFDPVTLGPKYSDLKSASSHRGGSISLDEAEEVIEAEFQKLVKPTKNLGLYARIVDKNKLPVTWIFKSSAGIKNMSEWDMMTETQVRKLWDDLNAYEDLHATSSN